MATTDASCIKIDLGSIRDLTGDQLVSRYLEIPLNQRLRHDFIDNLDALGKEAAYKCCLLLYTITNGKKVPREFQLESTIALLAGRDCLINAGTGSGKTLCMVLPALLDPTSVSLVISPLKRLQILQVTCILAAFRYRCSFPTEFTYRLPNSNLMDLQLQASTRTHRVQQTSGR